jgi:putative oxidoreductase
MYYDSSWIDAAGRLLIVGHYLVAGIGELAPAMAKHHVGVLRGYRVPFPAVAYAIGLTMKLTGCALLLSGWHADIGVYLLIVFTVIANAIYNRFWIMEDPVRRNFSRMLLSVNVAAIGGLLLLLANVR